MNLNSFILDLQKRQNIATNEENLKLQYLNAFQFTGESASAKNAFFANKIILIEGSSEAYVFPILFHLLGFQYGRDQIIFVICGGKSELDRFYRLYTEFGIPCYVIFDGDYHLEEITTISSQVKEKNKQNNRDLQEIFSDREKGKESEITDFPDGIPHDIYLGFPDCLEVALGFPMGRNKMKPLDLSKRIIVKYQDRLEQIPAWVSALIEKIKNLPSPPMSILKI